VDDRATRNAVVLAVVEIVGILAGRENNVTSGEEEDPVALTAFAVRGGLWSDLKTKFRCEANAYVESTYWFPSLRHLVGLWG